MVKTEEASKVALFYSAPSSAMYNILASVTQAYNVADGIVAAVAQDYYPNMCGLPVKGYNRLLYNRLYHAVRQHRLLILSAISTLLMIYFPRTSLLW